MASPTVLITGASGQIGTELTTALRDRYGRENVVASDVEDSDDLGEPFEQIDVTDRAALKAAVEAYEPDIVYHLAAILSATGEQKPQLAYDVNINGLYYALEVSREMGVEQLIVPSSISVFGPETPRNPGELTVLQPTTLYGISKVFGEMMGEYYYDNHDLDVRGVRFPGILSYKTLPGGGTTDYAVEVFYEALRSGEYTYFVREDTMLPMMYMPDAINALITLSESDGSNLRHRANYNVGALSFTPAELTAEIQKHLPEFEAVYEPDERQEIADSWPDTVDDSAAREDWGWEPEYGFERMVEDMIENLSEKELAKTS